MEPPPREFVACSRPLAATDSSSSRSPPKKEASADGGALGEDAQGTSGTRAVPTSLGSLPTSTGSRRRFLIFVIHGMGQRFGKLMTNIEQVTRNSQELLDAGINEKQVSIHFIPVDWHTKLHSLESVGGRMGKITLPTVPLMRMINNHYLADALYYFTSAHSQRIVDIIVETCNEGYANFMQQYPDWDPNDVSILGHSLGGIICYDILRHEPWNAESTPAHWLLPRIDYPQLAFRPKHLFAWGSPIAATLVMRGQDYDDFHLPDGVLLHNIFHPYDPMAYRLEPLIHEEYSDVDPVMMRHWNPQKSMLRLQSPIENILRPFLSVSASLPSLPHIQMPQLPSFDAFVWAASALSPTARGASHSPDSLPPPNTVGSDEQGSEGAKEEVNAVRHQAKRRRLDPELQGSGVTATLRRSHRRPPGHGGPHVGRPHTLRRHASHPLRRSGSVTLHPQQAHFPHSPNTEFPSTATQPSARPSRSLARLSSTLTDPDIEEAEEAALSNWFSSATYPRSSSPQPPSVSGSQEANSSAMDTDDRPLSSDREAVWAGATITASRFMQDMSDMISKTVARILRTDPQQGRQGGESTSTDGSASNVPQATEDRGEDRSRKRKREQTPKPLPGGRRLDYVLPMANLLDNVQNEYFSGLSSHFSYWGNKDCAYHLLQTLTETQETQE